MAEQCSVVLLSDPAVAALPGWVDPARLACTWIGGNPGAVPAWFERAGDQFVLGSPLKARGPGR